MQETDGRRFPVFTLLFVAATPLLAFAAVMHAGGGHGTYDLAKAAFPLALLATAFTGTIQLAPVTFSLLQLVTYGVLLDRARQARRLRASATTLALVHLALVAAAFALADRSFSP